MSQSTMALFVIVIFIAGLINIAQAACIAPGPPCVTVVQSITLPDVVKPSGAEANTTVQMTCDKDGNITSVAYSNNGNPFADGTASSPSVQPGSANLGVGNETGTCAELMVYSDDTVGDANKSYSITTGINSSLPTGISAIGAYTCISNSKNNTSCGTLNGFATDTIYCYGGVSVGTNAGTAVYSGDDLQVTVAFIASCP